MIREVCEEIGVVPRSFQRLASVAEPRPDLYGEAVATIFAVASWTGGDPHNASNEHVRIEWFSKEQLASLEGLAGYDYLHFARLAREAKKANSG